MPNGKPGDHPWTDIMIHGRRVYSALADQLVRDIAELATDAEQRQLADRLMREYNEHFDPDVARLERELSELRDRLRKRAAERGWEPRL
jgi:hypothetical protein